MVQQSRHQHDYVSLLGLHRQNRREENDDYSIGNTQQPNTQQPSAAGLRIDTFRTGFATQGAVQHARSMILTPLEIAPLPPSGPGKQT